MITNLLLKDWQYKLQKMKFVLIIILVTYTKSHAQIDSLKLLEHLQHLSSEQMQGRKPGTVGHELAQKYIINQFAAVGVKPFGDSYLQGFSYNSSQKEIKAFNIVGFLPGKSDKYIVISAHYDHLGKIGDQIYFGADDNASGTAALMELARSLSTKSLDHNVIFLASDAEESGIIGAKHFVANPPIALNKIVLNLNMDMIGRSDKSELYIVGSYHYPQLKDLLTPLVLKSSYPQVFFGHDRPNSRQQDWTSSSDHVAFHQKGIPFLYFGVEDHQDYHRPGDSFEKIHYSFYFNTTKWIHEAVNILLKEIK
jgi:Zn-dependent M28 family amino/carboxypeptidase